MNTPMAPMLAVGKCMAATLTGCGIDVNRAAIMSYAVTNIRQAHRDLTVQRILDAAVELMADQMDITLPLADIAARAGVTERTIYRHFASRDQLIEAVWPRLIERLQLRPPPETVDALIQSPLDVFPELERREGLVAASLYSPMARQAGRKNSETRLAAMMACAEKALPDMSDAMRRQRAAVLLMISSAYGWAVLKDIGGLTAEEAASAAAEAIAVLLGVRPASTGRPDTDKN